MMNHLTKNENMPFLSLPLFSVCLTVDSALSVCFIARQSVFLSVLVPFEKKISRWSSFVRSHAKFLQKAFIILKLNPNSRLSVLLLFHLCAFVRFLLTSFLYENLNAKLILKADKWNALDISSAYFYTISIKLA